MKLYWPVAIIRKGNAFDVRATYDGAMRYSKAVEQIRLWEIIYKMEIIAWRIDITENGEKVETPEKAVNMELVRELWKDFGDVPMNPETECIEDIWGRFFIGTHREEIWKWFEDTFYVSVAEDLMGL